MSWRFTPYTVMGNDVADLDTVNETLWAFTDEVSAQLNEHNWSEACIVASKFGAGVGQSIHHTRVPDDTAAYSKLTAADHGWLLVGEYLEQTITTKGRKLWVLASFQFRSSLHAHSFAIEVDGAILGETLIGPGDIGNDIVDTLINKSSFYGLWGSSPGVWCAPAPGLGIVVEGLISVTPGEHRIRIVHRPNEVGTDDNHQRVGDQELIVLEMW